MGKKFFSFNPFRRKKRRLWKKSESPKAKREASEEMQEEVQFGEEIAEELEEAGLGEETPPEAGPQEELLEAPGAEDSLEVGKAPQQEAPEALKEPEGELVEEVVDAGVLQEEPVGGELTEEDLGDLFESEGAVKEPQAAQEPVEETAEEPQAAAPVGEQAPRSEPTAESPVVSEPPQKEQTKPLPRVAEAPVGEEEAPEEEIQKVRDTVERLSKRAMTAGQLRQTIEQSIEKKLASLKEVVGRVQELFQQEAGTISTRLQETIRSAGSPSEALSEVTRRVQQLSEAVSTEVLAQLRDVAAGVASLAGGLSELKEGLAALKEGPPALNAVQAGLRDVRSQLEELRGRLPSGDLSSQLSAELNGHHERLVAWLEKLNVQAERQAREVQERHAELQAALSDAAKRARDLSEFRLQLNRIRSNLAAGLGDVREEILKSRLARSFLQARLGAALEPAQSALNELESLIASLEQS